MLQNSEIYSKVKKIKVDKIRFYYKLAAHALKKVTSQYLNGPLYLLLKHWGRGEEMISRKLQGGGYSQAREEVYIPEILATAAHCIKGLTFCLSADTIGPGGGVHPPTCSVLML